MDQPRPEKSRGCLKAGGIGCAICIVLFLAALLVILLNLDRIKGTDWYKSYSDAAADLKGEMAAMAVLRGELMREVPCQNIGVQARTVWGGGGTRHLLMISLINPKSLLGDSDESKEAEAERIARFVASVYPPVRDYDAVVIQLVRQMGAGFKVSTTKNYTFPVTSLFPPEEPSPSPIG